MIRNMIAVTPGNSRNTEQRHAGLFRRPSTLLAIAQLARAHNILPRVTAALAARHHMIERKLPRLAPAILTREPVTDEHFHASKSTLMERASDGMRESDNRGDAERSRHRVNLTPAVFHKLCLAAEHEDDGSSGPAHVMGFEPLVEDENRCVYHTGTLAVF